MIETDRLILRRWQARDRGPFAAMNADAEVMAHFPKRLTRKESDALVARMEDRWNADGTCFGVAERKADGSFVGMVGLGHLRFEPLPAPCVEVGWRLARGYWGQGYATEAAQGWLAHGFEAMGLDEVVAIAVPANVRSLKVMRRLGMLPDPSRAFDHPALPGGHALRPHVLHAVTREAWARAPARPSAGAGIAARCGA